MLRTCEDFYFYGTGVFQRSHGRYSIGLGAQVPSTRIGQRMLAFELDGVLFCKAP